MIDKWLESYSRWPAVNQAVFSAVVLIFFLVTLVLLGYGFSNFVYRLTVLVRGWPKEPEKIEPTTDTTTSLPVDYVVPTLNGRYPAPMTLFSRPEDATPPRKNRLRNN